VKAIRWRLLGGLAGRITLVSLAVSLVAIGVIALGVLVVARSTFDGLMIHAGSSAEVAQEMFDHGVALVFLVAAASAVCISIVLAMVLAGRLARPIDRMAGAASRVAGGDYAMKLPTDGPDELSSLAASMNRMSETLAEQERLRAEFIVNAAHELRTPLTNLKGYLEAMRDGVIEATPAQLDSLQEEVERLVRLARSLEALASTQIAPREARSERVDVSQAVRSALELARPSLEAKGIRCELDLPGELIAHAHNDHLSQVLANLIQNAQRYTPEAGHVAISAAAVDSSVVVSVVNTGDAIPEPDLPRIFDRFYRADQARTEGGSGLGLAIGKWIVEAHGGQIQAGNTSPHGAVFTVLLPIARAKALS
jgi:two-component system sensor histidine kinase BaeS